MPTNLPPKKPEDQTLANFTTLGGLAIIFLASLYVHTLLGLFVLLLVYAVGGQGMVMIRNYIHRLLKHLALK
ncbi:MAG: hypothetical protein EBR79_00775 [Proteobacteria bacterium]|nr:hypothetical protein [Pseudomonadota bacterium]NBX86729.1 hypothetical protein [Pseudomonadota bacterium]